MITSRFVFTFLLFALCSTTVTAQQAQYVDLTADAASLEPAPAPPTEAMQAFTNLLGIYNGEGLMTGLSYEGTMTIEPIMKGWYIRWSYDIIGSLDGEVGAQQIVYMIGWDRQEENYKIVRFGTESPIPVEYGIAYFENDKRFIMELNIITPNGKPGLMRNRIDISDTGRIEVVTEGEEEGTATIVRLGAGAFQRTL